MLNLKRNSRKVSQDYIEKLTIQIAETRAELAIKFGEMDTTLSEKMELIEIREELEDAAEQINDFLLEVQNKVDELQKRKAGKA